MDIFGIGLLELTVVLLIAVIVLGPARMVDIAGKMGRYWREAQRILREAADAATIRLDEPPAAPTDPATAPGSPEGAVARGDDDGSVLPDAAPESAAEPLSEVTGEEAERRG